MREPNVWEGRIVRGQADGPGVPGLRLELSTVSNSGERVVACAVSDSAGRYALSLPAGGRPAPKSKHELAIIDRTGAVIHRQHFGSAPSGRRPAVVSVIPATALASHEASPLLLERMDGPLADTDAMLSGLSTLLENIAPKGTPLHDRLMLGARCPLPPMALTAQLYGDAFGVLGGDPQSARRFAETLASLPAEPSVARSAEGARKPSGCGCSVDGLALGSAAWMEMAVPRDRAVPVIAAAAYVHQTGLFGADLPGRTVSVLCRIERLGKLFRLGVEGIGEPRAMQHLQAVLELGMPFPECPQRDIPPMPPLVECEPHRICMDDAIVAFGDARFYVVTAVSPSVACPGATVTITGYGFGTTAGKVRFGPVTATAASWSDTTIVVVVPAGAGNPLSLELPRYSRLVCNRLVEATPNGRIDASFEIGTPEILAFFAGSRPQPLFCVEPGQPIPVTWRVRGANSIDVRIYDHNGAVVAQSFPAPAIGMFMSLAAPQTSAPLRWLGQIAAWGACPGAAATAQFEILITRDRVLLVDGIEVTQAIQYYRAALHMTDASDRGPDNGLRLVTDKPAWVRAYLRSGTDPAFTSGPIAGVNGTLTVERRTGGVWQTVGTRPSQNGPVTALEAFGSYQAERSNINSSLNFIVPREWMHGMLRMTVDVEAPPEACAILRASAYTTVVAGLRQTLNAAFITVGYNGPDAAGNMVNLPAPAPADCLAETAWVLTTYPVSSTPNVRVAGTFVTTVPLNDPRTAPGACSPNWGPLLANIAALVAADQAANPGGNWAYYGLIANGIPATVGGCSGGATGGIAGSPIVYAHEIGHQFGLPHSRCGSCGAGNAAYPLYEPYDLPEDVPATPIDNTNWTMASTGEYGLDINNGNIADPNTAHDFMSYCGPAWISVFTHNFLAGSPRLSPVIVPSGGPDTSRLIRDEDYGGQRHGGAVRPLIHMLGRIDADGRVDVSSVARLETRYLAGDGVDIGCRAQLVGDEGRVLAEDIVYAFPARGGCGGAAQGPGANASAVRGVVFRAMLDDVAPGQYLRIVRGAEVLWERKRPPSPPVVESVRAAVGDDGVRLAWSVRRSAEYSRDAWIRWSDDGGSLWHALTLSESGDEVNIALEQLPSGKVQFQVLAHDGFSTAAGVSDTVGIPGSPPAVAILYPRTGHRIYADRQIRLWAAASNRGREPAGPGSFVWFIDDREVGRGADIWLENPGPGRHSVRVEVQGASGTSSAKSEIEIGGAQA